ncbi:MAG: motility-associated protein [Massilia sp.]
MQQLLGIAIVLGAVFGGFTLMGGTFTSIFHPIELLIIGGAALGALVLGNPRHVLAELGHQLKKVAARKKHDSEFQRQLLLLMYELLQTAAGGLKALDAHVEAPAESPLFQRYPAILDETKLLAFIVDNFRLMAMGKINAHELEGVLEQELEAIHEELTQPAKSLQKIAEAMPGFGILAAVLGIVMAMYSVSGGADSGEIAEKIGAAMVGTFIVNSDASTMETVKVVLCTHVAGKPALLAIDAGRRLIQLNTKPSFAQLEQWINAMGGEDESQNKRRRAADRMTG